jgi:hypothetical protein
LECIEDSDTLQGAPFVEYARRVSFKRGGTARVICSTGQATCTFAVAVIMIAAVSFRRQTPWLLGCSFDVMSDASEARSTLTPAAASFKTTRKGRSFLHPITVFELQRSSGLGLAKPTIKQHLLEMVLRDRVQALSGGGFTIRGFTVKGVFCVNYSFDHIFRT